MSKNRLLTLQEFYQLDKEMHDSNGEKLNVSGLDYARILYRLYLMPIEKIKTDIFKTEAEVIVNAVNTKGVSGCGIALQIKHRYPETQKLYEEACKNSWIKLGVPYIISVLETDTSTKYIICFPTKTAPKREEKSKLSTISNGLQIIKKRCLEGAFPAHYSIAIPKLGCGAGGLDEKDVVPLIENVLKEVPQRIIICV